MSVAADKSDRYVLIEGPRLDDAEFFGKWLLAAAQAEELWKKAYAQQEFERHVHSLCVVFLPDFAVAAGVLIAKVVKSRCSALVPLYSELGDEFTMLAGMGFFVLTGNRYQMTIPLHLTIEKVKAAILEYAETGENFALTPERLVTAMSLDEAKRWQNRLAEIPEQQRIAERTLLLGNTAFEL